MVSRRRQSPRRKTEKSEGKSTAITWSQTWFDEASAVVCFALSLFLLSSFVSEVMLIHQSPSDVSFGASDKRNWMGPIGHLIGTLLYGAMGWCALVPVICLATLAIYLWRVDQSKPRTVKFSIKAILGFSGVLLFSCTFISIFWGMHGGGEMGERIADPLVRFFNRSGAGLITLALLLLSLVFTTGASAIQIVQKVATWCYLGIVIIGSIPLVCLKLLYVGVQKGVSGVTGFFFAPHAVPEDATELMPKPRRRRNAVEELPPRIEELEDVDEAPPSTEDEYTHVVVKRRTPEKGATEREFVRKLKQKEPENVDPSWADAFPDYKLPALSLLTKGEVGTGSEDDNELREKSRQIENKLRDFGILGKVTQVHPGPVITLFEFEPAPGVKVGRIASLQDDLAMTLKASSIRIIAPIPRRGTVGIEVPNKHRDIVRLRDVLESDAFVNSESILSICVGKDTYGEPVVADIATMPHLLMAGATGTGKSVCINAALLSLLYRASPAELGMILIDPKILELSVYENIPHLRVPVVTHPRQAKAVLKWAIDEMNRRYRMMQKFGVRNIDGFNRIVAGTEEESEKKESLDSQVVMLKEESVVSAGTVDGSVEESNALFTEQLRPLPKIVIVIDELADLMLSVGRDIEELITRLAQKARAAGIHLIVATQRPSVDIITGLIKANFPARLSFRVSSRIDSRTILDSMGADKLLGRGDMLFMLPGAEAIRRVHGAFVSDSEVKKVIAAIKESGQPRYDERIMSICEKALEEDESANQSGAEGEEGTEGEYDSMYDKAVELVVGRGHASTSMIQRAFRIGYNRAARIIEMMEKDGVVGPMDGAKPREVLVPRTGDSEINPE